MTLFHKLAGGAALVMFASACSPDLNISNPNQPDVARAISTPGDVRQLIGSAYNTWYLGIQSGGAAGEPDPGLATGVMADSWTMAFGNFGARFNGQEPRLAYNNSSAAADGLVSSSPYNALYGALGSANDGLAAIKRGIVIKVSATAPDETPELQAFAYLIQGLTMGSEALIWDRGFVVDEDTPAGTATLQPYATVSAAAVAKFDKAIAAAAGKSWTVPTEYTPGMTLTADRFSRMANTMAARQLAYTPRTAAENAAVDWTRVLAYANKGISTGTPFSLTATGDGGNNWYDLDKFYQNSGWARVDQRVVQLADPTQPVVYTSTEIFPPRAQSADARFGTTATPGTDYGFLTIIPFAASRGAFFYSQWLHTRYLYTARGQATALTGDLPYVIPAENDLLIAEALVRTNGDKARAAALINNTRVGRGHLPALTGASSTNDLLAAIFYERDIELYDTGASQPWFDRRRIDTSLTYNGLPIGNTWGFRGGSGLQKGTPRSLPVPAAELETLGIPVYTFGGDAPNPVFPEK
jgi:hypothetical protein